MHPCCWGNLLQGFVPLVPILAAVILSGRKIFKGFQQYFLGQRHKIAEKEKSCCCPSKNISTEVLMP